MLAWFDTAFLEIKGATYNSNNTMLQLNYKDGNTKDGVPAPHESEDILNRNDKSEHITHLDNVVRIIIKWFECHLRVSENHKRKNGIRVRIVSISYLMFLRSSSIKGS